MVTSGVRARCVATGDTARERMSTTREPLTAQEAQIAGLTAELINSNVAGDVAEVASGIWAIHGDIRSTAT